MGRILVGNIMGPQGLQGIQGIQGPIGPIGPVGPMSPLINNALQTTAGMGALDAAMGKTLANQITQTNSDLALKINVSDFNLSRQILTKTIPSGTTSTEICSFTSTSNKLIIIHGWYQTIGNSTGVRQVAIAFNGADRYQNGTPAGQNLVGFSLIGVANAGQKVSIRATQVSGSGLTATIYVNSNVTFTVS